jgi:hypothetical protein
MTTRGKIQAALVSAAITAALVQASPPVARADTVSPDSVCINICGGGGPPVPACPSTGCVDGVTTAVGLVGDPDEGGQVYAVLDRLAGNHNETVLQLA